MVFSGLLLSGLVQQVQASGWFVGGGLQSVGFEDDLKGIESGKGITVSGGYRFNDVVSVELMSGFSFHDENQLNGEVVQNNLLVGSKLSLGSEIFQPYVTVGFSLHVVDFDYFDEIVGAGVYWGIGADIFLAKKHALNIGFRKSNWDGEDSVFDYNVNTELLSIVYNFHFSR